MVRLLIFSVSLTTVTLAGGVARGQLVERTFQGVRRSPTDTATIKLTLRRITQDQLSGSE